MRGQFDPDVWAALLLIIGVGVGGVIFLDLLVNSMSMNGILSLFDREISQKGLYIITSLSSNDYALVYQNGKDKNYLPLENFYVAGPTSVVTHYMYSDYIAEINNSLNKHHVALAPGSSVTGVCGFISSENDFNKYFKYYCGEKNIVYQYELYIYSPTGSGIAFFAFTNGTNSNSNQITPQPTPE